MSGFKMRRHVPMNSICMDTSSEQYNKLYNGHTMDPCARAAFDVRLALTKPLPRSRLRDKSVHCNEQYHGTRYKAFAVRLALSNR